MKRFLLIGFILLLAVLKGFQALPTRELTDEDWEALLELIGKSKNRPSNDNEYYESFTLKPIIFKMDFDDHFNEKDSVQLKPIKFSKKEETVPHTEKVPEEKSFWTGVKSFFTNDINSIAKDVADNYNPIPPIASVIDDVKRSDTWIDMSSFFTNSYNRLANFQKVYSMI